MENVFDILTEEKCSEDGCLHGGSGLLRWHVWEAYNFVLLRVGASCAGKCVKFASKRG